MAAPSHGYGYVHHLGTKADRKQAKRLKSPGTHFRLFRNVCHESYPFDSLWANCDWNKSEPCSKATFGIRKHQKTHQDSRSQETQTAYGQSQNVADTKFSSSAQPRRRARFRNERPDQLTAQVSSVSRLTASNDSNHAQNLQLQVWLWSGSHRSGKIQASESSTESLSVGMANSEKPGHNNQADKQQPELQTNCITGSLHDIVQQNVGRVSTVSTQSISRFLCPAPFSTCASQRMLFSSIPPIKILGKGHPQRQKTWLEKMLVFRFKWLEVMNLPLFSRLTSG